MDAIKYMSDSTGSNTGIWIDLNVVRKVVKKKKELVELMEEIEDIVALELTKREKSIPYEEARKQIFGKRK